MPDAPDPTNRGVRAHAIVLVGTVAKLADFRVCGDQLLREGCLLLIPCLEFCNHGRGKHLPKSPENVSWGMGVWGENRDLFDRMRREMIKSPDAYLKLLELVREADCAVGGAVWKKMVLPEGLPAALGILYPRRSLFFEKQGIDPESIYGPGIVRDVYRDYQRLMPFYRALTRCVEC